MFSSKKYIYNPIQANFLISNGCYVIGTGINTKTKNTYWIFNNDDTYNLAMTKWCSNKK